jgi:hypothetical protein
MRNNGTGQEVLSFLSCLCSSNGFLAFPELIHCREKLARTCHFLDELQAEVVIHQPSSKRKQLINVKR